MSENHLGYKLHNPFANETILHIHGGFSSGSEWDAVYLLLADRGYHLLIPDLPAHGESLHIHLFELDDAARRLSELIETEAYEGVAHIVAISIGAHIGAHLASQYPDRVVSMIVSGFNMFTPNIFTPFLPPLVYLLQRGSALISSPTAEWERLKKGQGSFGMTRDIFNILFSSRELRPISTRTLVVAATRDGISADNIDHS
ncbi:hypothetical protein ASPWEDRAFT_172921 [Aspergillus wentii DTO 134E9]|uniref:AB hydrolase-1 domain-containing protein n=1 Tax=Aspergillus wentii DTO 134E9 TaxID=1073089 RepID=A0A1L9RMK9_ASPWE|nr:uncharacterized protein ASPWEDRAFT_172921 [Aspergillus wentii DTO 134E9]KAI9929422.1 hypothetical protein MW887_000892 [Aspergillus wentii]OJJ36134.1 hypothetical protein ASPWEDRAFT_172921 [Aspergillus wentii DTO 134E9]